MLLELRLSHCLEDFSKNNKKQHHLCLQKNFNHFDLEGRNWGLLFSKIPKVYHSFYSNLVLIMSITAECITFCLYSSNPFITSTFSLEYCFYLSAIYCSFSTFSDKESTSHSCFIFDFHFVLSHAYSSIVGNMTSTGFVRSSCCLFTLIF